MSSDLFFRPVVLVAGKRCCVQFWYNYMPHFFEEILTERFLSFDREHISDFKINRYVLFPLLCLPAFLTGWLLIRSYCWLYILSQADDLLCRRLFYAYSPFGGTASELDTCTLDPSYFSPFNLFSYLSCILCTASTNVYLLPFVEIWILMDPNGSPLQVINLTTESTTA